MERYRVPVTGIFYPLRMTDLGPVDGALQFHSLRIDGLIQTNEYTELILTFGQLYLDINPD